MTAIDRLRALAERTMVGGRNSRTDALDEMYAALSPEVVLAMLDCIAAADAMRDKMRGPAPQFSDRMNNIAFYDAARALLK